MKFIKFGKTFYSMDIIGKISVEDFLACDIYCTCEACMDEGERLLKMGLQKYKKNPNEYRIILQDKKNGEFLAKITFDDPDSRDVALQNLLKQKGEYIYEVY